MKKLLMLVTVAVLLPIGVTAEDLGVVSTADYLRFPVLAVDSAGLDQAPDSGHVLVWFEGEATANSASYSVAWTDAGASGAYLDSVRYNSHTYYYFIDQVADIDNDEGNGVYTGVVILYTDGQPWPNNFTFTLAGDELADYWAAVPGINDIYDTIAKLLDDSTASLEELASEVTDSVWMSLFADRDGVPGSWGDSARLWTYSVLLAHLDTLAALSGAMFGARSKYSQNTDVDTIPVILNNGLDTIAWLIRYHPGDGGGAIPDSTDIVSGPDR